MLASHPSRDSGRRAGSNVDCRWAALPPGLWGAGAAAGEAQPLRALLRLLLGGGPAGHGLQRPGRGRLGPRGTPGPPWGRRLHREACDCRRRGERASCRGGFQWPSQEGPLPAPKHFKHFSGWLFSQKMWFSGKKKTHLKTKKTVFFFFFKEKVQGKSQCAVFLFFL